jgi:periplasmic protein CpxP/Spy
MFSKTSRLIAAAIVAMSVGIGSACAQSASIISDPMQQIQPVNMRQLHDQLNLNPSQEVQWQTALDAMRQSHAAERMNADLMQQQTAAMLQKPILDLSALHAAHEKVMQQDAHLPEQSAKAWLSFYNGLNDQQKTIMSDALRPELEKIAHHAARPMDPRTGL